jgi:ATP-dependent DNA ligase
VPGSGLKVQPPVEPMLAKLGDELPVGEYLYEPKWDGFRAIVFRREDDVCIQSRDARPLDRYFPELHDVLLNRLPKNCVVDGEIVIATAHGLDFDALQLRLHPAASRTEKLSRETPSSFIAFDVLAVDVRTADCVLAGFRWHKSGKDVIGSLLLGLYDTSGVLQHVGVASSFAMAMRRQLVGELAPLRKNAMHDHPWHEWAGGAAESSRVPGTQSRWSAGKDLSWEPLRIERVCEVKYDHMQADRFRHAGIFLRWRPDKRPQDCRFDQLEVVKPCELERIFSSGWSAS